MTKQSWFVCTISYFLSLNLSGQSITLTQLVVLPKRTMLNGQFIIYRDLSDRHITLPYKQNDFCIYFQADRLPPPYRYRLKDWNVDYEVVTANKYAFFTNIPSGKYTFSVWSAARPDLPPAQLNIRVESPMWLQWWFLPMLFLYAMLLVGAVFYFLYRYRLRQFRRVQLVRENIARDLHDDMGSYLSSISILSQSVENIVLTDPKRAQAFVKKIGETARQVMDSVGDIIWSVNPDNDSMTQIGVRMRDLGADLLVEQDVIFTLDLNDSLLQSSFALEQRRDFFLIYKEALSNIAKYANAAHVWVRLQRNDSIMELTIKDDGIGFNPKQAARSSISGGNGLRNMQLRAEKINGHLHISSSVGQGTTITLLVSLT